MQQITLNKVYDDSAKLFIQIHESGFYPDVIASVYKGGCSIIAPTIIELFMAAGHNNFYHTPFKASSYNRPGERDDVKFEGLDALKERLKQEDKVLIVEDIIDEGKTFEKIMHELKLVSNNVKFAVLYWRKDKHKGGLTPNYYVEEVTQWINFPHEISDLANQDLDLLIEKGGPWIEVADILKKQKK
ncbi:MAG TPA: phosphoribosyltransferase family protein [Candidatus Nanoarchaeia archaeon]|nr:phosphoribosyltransferase family protein [Candidatus Nanoarchaeia archaeon]